MHVQWENYLSFSFHIEWDMIVVTVLLSIFNQMEFDLVQNRKENCHHDHIPFNLKGNGNIVFSVYMHSLCLLFWIYAHCRYIHSLFILFWIDAHYTCIVCASYCEYIHYTCIVCVSYCEYAMCTLYTWITHDGKGLFLSHCYPSISLSLYLHDIVKKTTKITYKRLRNFRYRCRGDIEGKSGKVHRGRWKIERKYKRKVKRR